MSAHMPVRLKSAFPKATQYDQEWVRQHSMGENVLYNLESLTSVLPLKPGMRVLDLGSGKGISSVFLAMEFGLQVWAVDEAISPTETLSRVREAGCEDRVFPLQLDARNLCFPEEYFDAVIVVDSYTYFGTDEKYLPYISRFIKPGGYLAIADVCFSREIDNPKDVPAFLRKDYQQYWYYIHTVDWWRKLWSKTGLVEIVSAEILPAATLIREQYIQDYQHALHKDPFAKALTKDKENLISFFRLVGRRTSKEAFLQSYK